MVVTELAIPKSLTFVLILGGLLLIATGTVVLTSQALVTVLVSLISAVRRGPVAADLYRNLRLSGIEALVEGGLAFTTGVFIVPRWRAVSSSIATKSRLLIISGILLAVLWIPVVIFGRSAIIGGERFWWLGDDAMISMRYAHNLVTGAGLVWNPGERVEGYSNLLWTLYMALVHLLPVAASKISLLVLLTNVILSIAIIPLIGKTVDLLGGGILATVGALASYVLSRDIMYWSTYGFETVLLTLLMLVAACRLLQESRAGRPTFVTYLVIGLIALVRADAITIACLFYGIALLLNRDRKAVLLYIAGSLILPLGAEAWRVSYYGDFLPNTAYLKTANWDGKLAAGLAYVSSFALHYAVPFVLAGAGAILSGRRDRWALLAAVLAFTPYVAYVGGDAFPSFRFFVPFVPLLMILAFLGVEEVGRSLFRRPLQAALGIFCIVTIPLIVPGYAISLFPYPADEGNVQIGLALKANTPPGSKIADFWAGSVLYFSERPGVDLLGKVDPYIAHLSAAPDRNLPGHNKFDFAHSLGELKPDFIVSHFKLPVSDEEMRRSSSGSFAYVGLLYFDPIFRSHCWSYPLPIDTWRSVFACHWSS